MALLLLLAAGCARQAKPYQETRFLLDTVVEMTAYGPNAQAAVTAAFGEVERIHALANIYDADSQLSQVNAAAGRHPVTVDPALIQMVARANELSAKLDGAFDVSIGALSRLWGVGHKGDYVPSDADILAALPLVDYKAVVVDQTRHTLYLPRAGMSLDLGGVAKGYAVDKAIEKLKEYGVRSALINAGGDVRVIGERPDGKPWRIGVQHPRQSDGMIAKLALTDWDTMETSGDYQRYFIKNGKRYSHILNPKTGRQPRQIISATIVNNNSADGDILSTAIFVVGVDEGLKLLKRFPGVEAIIMTNDGSIVTTPGLQGKVEIVAAR